MLINSFCLLLTCCFIWPVFASRDQDKSVKDDPIVQLKAELIEVRAVVTDKQGRLVEGLKKEDFELLEKGRPQQIGFFSEHRLGSPFSPQTDRPDRAAITQPRTLRSIMIVVDTLNMGGESLLRVKQSLKRFLVENLTANDEVMIIASGGTDGFTSHFTRDREMLRYAVDRLQYWGGMQTSFFTPTLASAVKRGDREAYELAVRILESEGTSEMGVGGRDRGMVDIKANQVLAEAAYRRMGALNTVRAAAQTMAKAPGQRLLLVISDGFSLTDLRGDRHTADLQAAVSRAARSGVVIYSVNAKGLEPPAAFDASRRGITGDAETYTVLSRYMSSWEKDALEGMNSLAKDTGGDTFFKTNDIVGALKKSIDDNRVYYALAYYASNPGSDSSFRSISVRVKNHPEYSVRAHKGYLASDLLPKSDMTLHAPEQQLFNALAEPIASSAISLSAGANYLEIEKDKAAVSLHIRIDGSKPGYQEQQGQTSLSMDLAIAIYDRGGGLVKSYTEKIFGTMSPERLAVAKASGFQYAKRLELKPGLYQIRAGVRETETGRMGTSISWVEVADLSKKKPTLSSILLSDGEEPGSTKDARSATPARWHPIKSYSSGSLLVYYLRAYNIPVRSEAETLMQSEISQGDESIYRSDWQPVSARVLGRDRKGIDIGGQLSVSLKPGLYELKVSVRNSHTKQAIYRTVMFLVEG